jgi:hypothetical protein
MAAHTVKLKVEHPLNVGNLGVEFEVRRGGKLLGKLEVTQTTLEWTPAKARNPRKASWQDFGDWMEARSGRPAQARPAAPRATGADDVIAAVEAELELQDEEERDDVRGAEIDLEEDEEIDTEEDEEIDLEEDDVEDLVDVVEIDTTPPPGTRTGWV